MGVFGLASLWVLLLSSHAFSRSDNYSIRGPRDFCITVAIERIAENKAGQYYYSRIRRAPDFGHGRDEHFVAGELYALILRDIESSSGLDLDRALLALKYYLRTAPTQPRLRDSPRAGPGIEVVYASELLGAALNRILDPRERTQLQVKRFLISLHRELDQTSFETGFKDLVPRIVNERIRISTDRERNAFEAFLSNLR